MLNNMLERLKVLEDIKVNSLDNQLTRDFNLDELTDLFENVNTSLTKFSGKYFLLKYYISNKSERKLIDGFTKSQDLIVNMLLNNYYPMIKKGVLSKIVKNYDKITDISLNDIIPIIYHAFVIKDFDLDTIIGAYNQFSSCYDFNIDLMFKNDWVIPIQVHDNLRLFSVLISSPEPIKKFYQKFGYYNGIDGMDEVILDYLLQTDNFSFTKKTKELLNTVNFSQSITAFFDVEPKEHTTSKLLEFFNNKTANELCRDSRFISCALWCLLNDKDEFLEIMLRDKELDSCVQFAQSGLYKLDFDVNTIKDFSSFSINGIRTFSDEVPYNLEVLEFLNENPDSVKFYNTTGDLQATKAFKGMYNRLSCDVAEMYFKNHSLEELEELYSVDTESLSFIISSKVSWRAELLPYAKVIQDWYISNPTIDKVVDLVLNRLCFKKFLGDTVESHLLLIKRYLKVLDLISYITPKYYYYLFNEGTNKAYAQIGYLIKLYLCSEQENKIKKDMLYRYNLSLRFPYCELPKELKEKWEQLYNPNLGEILKFVYLGDIDPNTVFSILEPDKLFLCKDKHFLILNLTHNDNGKWLLLSAPASPNESESIFSDEIDKIKEFVGLDLATDSDACFLPLSEGSKTFTSLDVDLCNLSGYYHKTLIA